MKTPSLKLAKALKSRPTTRSGRRPNAARSRRQARANGESQVNGHAFFTAADAADGEGHVNGAAANGHSHPHGATDWKSFLKRYELVGPKVLNELKILIRLASAADTKPGQ
jgi:hypothetical protein